MTLSQIFSQNYLFDINPTPQSNLYIPLLILFGLMIVLAAAISFQRKSIKKVVGKFFVPLLSAGVLGLIYLFARHESLPYLSSRFFLVLIICMFLAWVFILLVWSAKFIPKYMNSQKIEDRYNRYLPKAKKKNG